MKAKIAEIFTSIQGEGPYVGVNQLFIRFCGCNISCNFCDTKFDEGRDYSVEELLKVVEASENIHSVSLTGGEPLLWADFLKEFLPKVNKKIYLETNATLPNKLAEVINFVDIISADIKLESSSGVDTIAKHDEFFKVAKDKDLFAKIVFDETITDKEIQKCCELGEKYDIELILQPKTMDEKVSVTNAKITEIFNKFLSKHEKTRVIPQTHVFMNVI